MKRQFNQTLIQVSSKTYNACTTYIENTFGFRVNHGHPRERFEYAVAILHGALKEATQKTPKRRLEDYADSERKGIMLMIAGRWQERAELWGEEQVVTREDFVREAFALMKTEFGF